MGVREAHPLSLVQGRPLTLLLVHTSRLLEACEALDPRALLLARALRLAADAVVVVDLLRATWLRVRARARARARGSGWPAGVALVGVVRPCSAIASPNPIP